MSIYYAHLRTVHSSLLRSTCDNSYQFSTKMPFTTQFNDRVFGHLNELTSRVIVESGRPSDRFHLGKVILQSLKDSPDFVLQIDGATGQSETCGSILERSIKCATALKNYGFTIGDVIMVSAPNHLDLAVLVYAAQYNGQIVCPVWTDETTETLECLFTAGKPQLIVCENDQLSHIQDVLYNVKQDPLILTFNESANTFGKFNDDFGSNSCITEFKAADFNPVETLSFLMLTSGTTGHNKCVALTHSNIMSSLPYRLAKFDTFAKPTHSVLVLNQFYFLSCQSMFFYTVIFRIRRIQSSAIMTMEHLQQLIRNFKPTIFLLNPNIMTSLIKAVETSGYACDLTCFELLRLGGCKVTKAHVETIKAAVPKATVVMNYGMTEIGSICSGICTLGRPLSMQCCGHIYAKLVDQDSGNEITEPNAIGEMWVKTPAMFKFYYNNEAETKQVFSKDGWFKTGDLFYRDAYYNFFFIGRIRLTIYYKSKQVLPFEIEGVISQHPGVMQVAVIGVPDDVDDELPMAFVVRKGGYDVTAKDIKDVVKDSLPEFNRLRGGVVFMSSLPLTPSLKTNYKKLKEMVHSFIRE